jgi:hypothetical protein
MARTSIPQGRRLARRALLAFVFLALPGLIAACGGDDDDDGAPADGDQDNGGEVIVDDEDDADDEEGLDVDNCTLLTDEEVSTLSDEPLFVSEDGPLGCGWLPEDGAIAEFSIRSFRSDQSVAEYAAEFAPSLEVVELEGVGDEAAALVREGEANFIIARNGDLFVELVLTFLDMEVGSENLQRAQDLADLALGRLKEAS